MSKKNIFNEFYKQYAQAIFRFIYFKVSDYELAQDLTEDTFVRFWKRLKDIEIDNGKALLYTIAKGIVIDEYRKSDNKALAIEKVDERLLTYTDNNENELQKREEIEKIFSTLKKIKKEYQEVILLHFVDDLTVMEIADILEKKENNVRVLLSRAIKALKEVI